MGSSSLSSSFQISSSTNFSISPKPSIPHHRFLIRMPTRPIGCSWSSSSSSSSPSHGILRKSLPLAASIAILLWSTPGLMSGFSGIESVPGPQLPQIDFLNRLNEENQKKYAEFDERFKSSPLLKKLLEQSKLNKEKNRREIQDKYCIRGAEWGVGDCSAEGMSPDERDKFIAMLKQKAAEK
ncbi:uncharacterized protein LOC114758728 isoform X2 [Neltuma alba]|uniref:uncharacterized protein LOC114758728 isoform X2 n=1 Tax=Neltuma alba TaxID=207710 RepID=UPI0010A508C4|nr:uncharacterized protein LOC114758728 isoform X2 [Prosopis alba]